MAKSLVGFGLLLSVVGVNEYFPFQGLYDPGDEANSNFTIRLAGTFSSLYISAYDNGMTEITTITSRKNGADGNITISIPATTTGEYSDTAHSDSISAGDEFNWEAYTADSSMNYPILSVGTFQFEADSNTVCFFTALILGDTSDEYCFQWSAVSDNANNMLYKCFTAGTLKNLCFIVVSNAHTVTVNQSSYINTAAGNLTVSITGETTGVFEDTAHTDTIDNDDKICFFLEAGDANLSGVGKIEFETTNNNGDLVSAFGFELYY